MKDESNRVRTGMSNLIKVCGMKDADNIRDLIAINPDMMGMIFYPDSPRFVSEPEKLTSALKSKGDTKLVGVFVNQSIAEITDMRELFKLNFVQLHGNESPAFCEIVKNSNTGVIKAFGISGPEDLKKTIMYEGVVDYFLFDTKSKQHGGSGKKFDWNILDQYHGDTPFILSGGIGPGDYPDVSNPLYAGVDLNSRFEKSPGIKEINLLREYFKKYRYDK